MPRILSVSAMDRSPDYTHLDEQGSDTLQNLVGRRELRHRCREICIRPSNSREQGAYLGQHVLEVEVIELSDRSLRLAEIEDADFPVGAQNAEYLSQPSVVICEVSKSERRRHEVKGGVSKRHLQSVGFHPAQRSSLPFDLRTTQHLARKICAGNRGSASAGAPIQSKGHVAGPAAEIEHLCIVLAEDVAESTSGTPPPET